MNSTPGPRATGSTPIQPGTCIGQNIQACMEANASHGGSNNQRPGEEEPVVNNAGNRAATSTVQGDDRPSNSTEQMNRKREEMMIALKGLIETTLSASVSIKAWADILQQGLDCGSEAGDGALRVKVEEISFIATVAVRSDKDGKGECLLKLTCGKDDPHVRKPSVEKLAESHKKSKEAMDLPSEKWSMVDVLDDIKNVMADHKRQPLDDKPNN